MAFLTIANKISEYNIVVFSDQYREFLRDREIPEKTCMFVRGTFKENKERGNSIFADQITFPRKRF